MTNERTHMTLCAIGLQLLELVEQKHKVQQMIQQYGQDLTGVDARLALEYYWQAAAVVNSSHSVQVLPLLTTHPSCTSDITSGTVVRSRASLAITIQSQYTQMKRNASSCESAESCFEACRGFRLSLMGLAICFLLISPLVSQGFQ